MVSYSELYTKSKLDLDSAEHLLYVTYNISKDSNFIMSVTSKLLDSVKKGLASLMLYERSLKNIEAFPKQFSVLTEIFNTKVSDKRNFDPVIKGFLRKMVDLDNSLKSSSIHYRRDSNFVIAESNFDTRSYDLNTLKTYFDQSQEFITKVGDIINESE